MATEEIKPEPMTREEAKRILRRLELDAYSAVVTAFRAQGDMNKSKKFILGELSNQLSISTERHRAEVRRVVNDDRLNAVAECMHGPGTSTEWSIEGCRLVSLMPRLVPQTVFTAKATAAANQAVENNQKLPIKSEIEVLPLPTKLKSMPPKNDRMNDNKDDKSHLKSSLTNDSMNGKVDDKLKKKKKPNILYTKPSPLALNKTLTNPFKPSSTPSSLKSMIKNTPLKYSSMGPVTKPTSTLSVSSTPATYSPKPIILQRSPTKNLPSNTRAPSIHLQSINTSLNTPLTSLSALGSNKSEHSPLVQPMIKVVSNSQNLPVSVTSVGINSGNNSITQKIKFKTPLPKPKVKATKFKPMVPLQRPSILSSSQNNSEILLGASSSTVTVTPTSPNKPGNPSQGMSVKVVQVTKSSGQSTSSLMSSLNKPVVVVSNNGALKTPSQKLTFSAVPSSVTQQLKVASGANLSTSISQSLPKGTLTSKSMPLATGFKMIAVTTVVPGTTQVKTVYIATPIMSLTKTVSQTTGSSITTAAPQNVRHISSSLASNLQSVVARSINTSHISNTGKAPSLQNISSTPSSSSANHTSISIGKTSKLTATPKGLGSLKTTLAGTAQSLKLFTAVSKTRSPLGSVNTSKTTPLLPSTSLLTSVVGQHSIQRAGTLQAKLNETHSNRIRNEKLEISNASQSNTSNSTFLNISTVGLNSVPQITNGLIHTADGTSIQAAISVNANNLEEMSATLNLLNDENSMTTEQITATATADTDDMAFLNAGEKFLEQLSAKMTATSPDSFTKNEAFLFPPNMTLDISNDPNQSVFELSKDTNDYEISTNLSGSITIDKNVILQNGNGMTKQPAIIAKETNYFLSQKSLPNGPKLLNNLLPPGAKVLQPTSSSLSISNFSHHNSGGGVQTSTVMVAPVFQPKNELNTRTVLNYTNITNVSGKTEMIPLSNKDSNVGFISVGGNTSGAVTIDGNVPKSRSMNSINISSPQTSNKLPMSIPGSSKLNISPILVKNMTNANSITTDISKVNFNSADSQITHNLSAQVVNNALNPLSNLQFYVSPSSNNDSSSNIGGDCKLSPSQTLELLNKNAKRKFGELTSTARTQVSWVRSAANLLARVSRFRGANKQKGDMNAASWFTKPVDPVEAPGYYGIIKIPMDFGKIKRKLEDGEYENYTQFYEDMVLVKKNCYAYNPVGHMARKDCDDVFSFFDGEYQKLLDRWEKHHVSPQKRAKLSDENGNS